MKKLIIVLAAGMIAAESMGQNAGKSIAPPPPPAPPQEVQFTPPKIAKDMRRVPAAPPSMPNEKGYAILVQPTKEEPVILLTKKGITQKIRMRVWNAKPQYFENKYGKLPPPPPPAPNPPVPPPPPPKPPRV